MAREEYSFLAPFTAQEAHLRWGQILFKRLKMEAWMSYKHMCFGMEMSFLRENFILKGDINQAGEASWSLCSSQNWPICLY
ncbi:hypothetical protein ACHQM5_002495 [Ranunculus cassubicifolius]